MPGPPRVAFFPDSFHEVNGVAHTSRNFAAYAERHALPMLCVRAGLDRGATATRSRQGSLETLELPRSRAAVGLEKDLSFDPLFWRYADAIERELHRFRPDVLHLTGPSELGIFAAYFAWKLGVPLAASWHTNVHEYAARRMQGILQHLPTTFAGKAAEGIEGGALGVSAWFYRLAGILFAPNDELCALLHQATGKPCHRMQRGVDTELFAPARRTRPLPAAAPFTLGYVGRLSVEKNVALLPRIAAGLEALGIAATFSIVGHGAEEASLRAALPTAHFPGVLRGGALSAAVADFDLFVFPSHTDTFGNVVLEALASGVPAVVTPDGGPRFIVRPDTGLVVNDADFAAGIAGLLGDPARLAAMRLAARAQAMEYSWDAVFEKVYAAYDELLEGRAVNV